MDEIQNSLKQNPTRFYPLFSIENDLLIFIGPILLTALALVMWQAVSRTLFPYVSEEGQRTGFYMVYAIALMVPHNYATFYKVYCDSRFNPNYYQFQLKIFAGLFVCVSFAYLQFRNAFLIGLTYLDIFHHLRQQYGWVALAQRKQSEITQFEKTLDRIMIYNVTLSPLIWWHSHPTEFGWMAKNDILFFIPEWVGVLLFSCHWLLNTFYLSIYGYWYVSNRGVNLSKILIIFTTWVAWYLGILYLRDGMKILFITFSHTMPYLFLVFRYYNSHDNQKTLLKPLPKVSWKRLYGYLILISSAIVTLQFVKVPSLSYEGQAIYLIVLLGGMFHYFFDTFIWRIRTKESRMDYFFKFH